MDLMGLVEFTEIRPHCTEVSLAVHYEIKNKFFAWLDRRLHFVDAFLTSELRSIRAHFEGIAAPHVEPLHACRCSKPSRRKEIRTTQRARSSSLRALLLYGDLRIRTA